MGWFIKTVFLFISLLSLGLLTNAQKVGSVDFDAVKSLVQNKNSEFNYDKLIKRFMACDSTLTDSDYYYLYYGSIYTPYYKNLGDINEDKVFYGYFNSTDYKDAITQGIKILNDNPFNLPITLKLAMAYFYTKDTITGRRMGRRYVQTLLAVTSTGDGKSEQSAFVVLTVPDEYEVLGQLQLTSIRQSLVDSYDVLDVQTPNKLNVDKVYFNIAKELEKEEQFFKKN